MLKLCLLNTYVLFLSLSLGVSLGNPGARKPIHLWHKAFLSRVTYKSKKGPYPPSKKKRDPLMRISGILICCFIVKEKVRFSWLTLRSISVFSKASNAGVLCDSSQFVNLFFWGLLQRKIVVSTCEFSSQAFFCPPKHLFLIKTLQNKKKKKKNISSYV